MTEPRLPRRPSDDLPELRNQLLAELERLEKEGKEAGEPWLFRAYLQHAQALAWQGVAEGKLGIPRQILDVLLEMQPIVDANSPETETLAPASRAALEVDAVIRSLHAAAQTMEEAQASLRLADGHSKTERAILQVLLDNRGTYLRRGEVHEQLAPEQRPTAPRIGQILAELYHQGLLLRIHGRAQGSPKASFYTLSPKGLEMCARLNLREEDRPGAELPWHRLQTLVEIVLNPTRKAAERSIARGVLASHSAGANGERILAALEEAAAGPASRNAEVRQLFDDVRREVLLAKRSIESLSGSEVEAGVLVFERQDPSRLAQPGDDLVRELTEKGMEPPAEEIRGPADKKRVRDKREVERAALLAALLAERRAAASAA